MDKKAQAAMEFMFSYGWAIVLVIAALSGLSYYFLSNNGNFGPDACIMIVGIGCPSVIAYEDSASFSVVNGMGIDMSFFSVESANCEHSTSQISLLNGEKQDLSLSGCDYKGKKVADDTLLIRYRTKGSSIDHSRKGKLRAKVEEGCAQVYCSGSGGGSGYSSDANTVALYKLDENGGSLILDSSTNNIGGTFHTLGNLVDNGNAETGTTVNWEGMTGIDLNAHQGNYALSAEGQIQIVNTQEDIPIDVSKQYNLAGWFQSYGVEESKMYFGFIPYDKDKVRIKTQEINPNELASCPTETELYEDIITANQDFIKIKDGSCWNPIDLSAFVAFDVDDSGQFNDLPNRRLSNSDITGVAYIDPYWEVKFGTSVGRMYPKDTKIRQHRSGGSYIYTGNLGDPVTKAWEKYQGSMQGEHQSGAIPIGKWWRGTKFAKIMIIPNYKQTPNEKLRFDDISVTTIPVTYTNNWNPGVFGSSLTFNGVDEYIDLGSNSAFNVAEQITLEAWINTQDIISAGKYQRIIQRSSLWGLYVLNGNIVFYLSTDNGWKSVIASLPSANQWYHIAGVYDGENLRLYINGQESGNSPVAQTGLIETGSTKVSLGADYGSSASDVFLGSIDEVRISDVARY